MTLNPRIDVILACLGMTEIVVRAFLPFHLLEKWKKRFLLENGSSKPKGLVCRDLAGPEGAEWSHMVSAPPNPHAKGVFVAFPASSCPTGVLALLFSNLVIFFFF